MSRRVDPPDDGRYRVLAPWGARPEATVTDPRQHGFLGGSPGGVLVRLLLLSLVVGAVLGQVDVGIADVVAWFRDLADWVASLGFGAFERAGRYLLTGALIVVPLFLLSRLLARRS